MDFRRLKRLENTLLVLELILRLLGLLGPLLVLNLLVNILLLGLVDFHSILFDVNRIDHLVLASRARPLLEALSLGVHTLLVNGLEGFSRVMVHVLRVHSRLLLPICVAVLESVCNLLSLVKVVVHRLGLNTMRKADVPTLGDRVILLQIFVKLV